MKAVECNSTGKFLYPILTVRHEQKMAENLHHESHSTIKARVRQKPESQGIFRYFPHSTKL